MSADRRRALTPAATTVTRKVFFYWDNTEGRHQWCRPSVVNTLNYRRPWAYGRAAARYSSPAQIHPAPAPWPDPAHLGAPCNAGCATTRPARALHRLGSPCAGASRARPPRYFTRAAQPVLPPGLIGDRASCALPAPRHAQPLAVLSRQCPLGGFAPSSLQPHPRAPFGRRPGPRGWISFRFMHHRHKLLHPRQPVRADPELLPGHGFLVRCLKTGIPSPRHREVIADVEAGAPVSAAIRRGTTTLTPPSAPESFEH